MGSRLDFVNALYAETKVASASTLPDSLRGNVNPLFTPAASVPADRYQAWKAQSIYKCGTKWATESP